ncbi:hypothetical protein D0469_01695 [Peribacillus saganii]|uniref:Recombinase family protein n=1 Tax=Peribacillus saganii TaxID=2303992 RepID=A0A372LTA3_9BACI|nr:recombinase family protein [Peribacillus saganii]RFU71445.1 hypothetical protein D0469_01695 [Peribacillus saganii]
MDEKMNPREMIQKVKKPAFYGRVSTDLQDQKRQDSIVKNYAANQGIEINEDMEFIDEISAYRVPHQKRKQFQELFKAVKRDEVDGIIVSDIDRLSRQTLEHFDLRKEFDRLNIPVFIASKGELYSKYDVENLIRHLVEDGMTKLESDNNSTRTRDTLKTIREKGKYSGGRIPYGYRPVKKTENKNGKEIQIVCGFIPVDDEIAVIKRIFQLYQGKETLTSLAKMLSIERPHEKWQTKKVRFIVTNPFYTGFFVYNRTPGKKGGYSLNPMEEWEWVKCDWVPDPPISKEQWLLCWRKYEESKTLGPQHFCTSFSFNDVLFCHCGKEMKGKDQRTKSKKTPGKQDGYRYYICACGQKVLEECLHQQFLVFYHTLPNSFNSLFEEVEKRFRNELKQNSSQCSRWQVELTEERESLHQLILYKRKIEKENVYLEEAKDEVEVAWLISKNHSEDTIIELEKNIENQMEYIKNLQRILADRRVLEQFIHNSLNGITQQSRFLRALVLLMVKDCKLVSEDRISFSFYAMPDQILTLSPK